MEIACPDIDAMETDADPVLPRPPKFAVKGNAAAVAAYDGVLEMLLRVP
jgi:hypothetical protein